jgi:hypothetical protein
MGLGQSLMSMLAIALLGTVLLMMSTSTLDSGASIEAAEFLIMGNSLGISQMERAAGLSFDEHTVSADVASPTGFTLALGKEGAEVEATFDDFDDFHGFEKVIAGDSIFFRTADFHIKDSVDYVRITGNTVVPSISRTYHKRLRVWVSSPFMRDTLMFSTIYSYWYFR